MVVDSAVNVKEECVFSAVEHTIRGKEFQWYADSVGAKVRDKYFSLSTKNVYVSTLRPIRHRRTN